MTPMDRKRYAVEAIADDPNVLQNALDRIDLQGGRVLSVIWTPERFTRHLSGGQWSSGYTIVAEFHENGSR
jgi:hypothetical protein